MKKFYNPLLIALFVIALSATSCNDFLSVENRNAPDRERALSRSDDVENLIASSFFTWWKATQNKNTDVHLSVAADETTDRWNQYSFGILGCQREAFTNDPAFQGKDIIEKPWFELYQSLQSSSEGVKSIQDGIEIGENGENNARALAFGRFVQGLSLGWIALMFDKAFVVDETVEATSEAVRNLELQNYDKVMDAAIDKLQKAAEIADNNSFTLPDGWINGNPMSSDRLARLSRSYMARYLAQLPRTPEERQNVDWERVIELVDNGIENDFWVLGDGRGNDKWHDFTLKFIAQFLRVDNLTIGAADTSGDFEEWLNTNPSKRKDFIIYTNDRRVAGEDSATAPGKYFKYDGPSTNAGFYTEDRYHDLTLTFSSIGEIDAMYVEEMNLLKAEALLWLNRDLDKVAELINKSRVVNGELPPAQASNGPGSRQDDASVKQSASLWAKLKYEKRIELYATSTGLEYFDDRGWGDLAKDQALHFPVPAEELITLNKELYTFGGGGQWSSNSDLVTCPESESF